MIIAVQTGGIVERFGVEACYDMIARAGFGGVDVNLDHFLTPPQITRGERVPFFAQSDEQMRKAVRPQKEAAERNGIRFVQAHGLFPTITADEAGNSYVLEAQKKIIMLCGYLGCPNLVVHPGFRGADERMSAQEEWDFNIAMYSALIPSLKEHGVTCCLENMFISHRGKIMQAICSEPAEANRYIDALNEIAGQRCFGFCLDVGHALLVGKDIHAAIHQLGDRIRVLHVHDNNGLDDEHLLPYMGLTDWDRFCRGLREIGYAGDLSFETFNAMNVFDDALAGDVLRLLYATGELFVERIRG